MKITSEWLKEKNACESSFDHICNNGYINLEFTEFIKKLIKNNRINDANWLITNYMTKRQNVMYAIYAAEQVIEIFEKKYSDDERPRKAIETAKEYLINPCKKTKNAAAAHAAHAAAAAANAAHDAAAYAAANAAYAAYAAANAAANAAHAAAAAHAAHAAAAAANAARKEMKLKILKNGLKIIHN